MIKKGPKAKVKWLLQGENTEARGATCFVFEVNFLNFCQINFAVIGVAYKKHSA